MHGLADDGSIAFRQGIANLESLLASLIIPQATALLANYPNPFNPETWIPYQLAVPAEVTLTIFDMNGGTVRRLDGGAPSGGHVSEPQGVRCIGTVAMGVAESVASGLYFLYAECRRVHGNTQDAGTEVDERYFCILRIPHTKIWKFSVRNEN